MPSAFLSLTSPPFLSSSPRLLDAKVELIAVEDTQLASSLATSIQIGNVLHKVSVLSGLGGLLCASVLPSRSVPQALMPLSLVSLATAWT